MSFSKSKKILNNRPEIFRLEPKSTKTIPTLKKSGEKKALKEERVVNIVKDLKSVAVAAAAVEEVINSKAKNLFIDLNLNNPEDFIVAQSAAREFPESAEDIAGLKVVKRITFDMYKKCIDKVKKNGISVGSKNKVTAKTFDPLKTNFGGLNKDRRPELNTAALPFEPIDLSAFIAGVIPALFTLLFPLINSTVKANIIGHTHPVAVPSAPLPVPSGPGIPVVP